MGVNIYLDVYGWNQFINGSMKEIYRNNEKFPKTYKPLDRAIEDPWDRPEFRPSDFDHWRNELQKQFLESSVNLNMWLNGLEEMEKDESLWFSVSQ